MTYQCKLTENYMLAYFQGKQVGRFDINTFFTILVSPVQFRQFQKNPSKQNFNIRKIEFNAYNLNLKTLYELNTNKIK